LGANHQTVQSAVGIIIIIIIKNKIYLKRTIKQQNSKTTSTSILIYW